MVIFLIENLKNLRRKGKKCLKCVLKCLYLPIFHAARTNLVKNVCSSIVKHDVLAKSKNNISFFTKKNTLIA